MLRSGRLLVSGRSRLYDHNLCSRGLRLRCAEDTIKTPQTAVSKRSEDVGEYEGEEIDIGCINRELTQAVTQ